MNRSTPVNSYGRQLTEEEIGAGLHREFVGGMWDEIGQLQFAFMKRMGLGAGDRLLDVGCGALRGGIHFIRYLAEGNYYGMDVNASLIEAGKRELRSAALGSKKPHLMVGQAFEVSTFGTTFQYALAVSLFTHLTTKLIVGCLDNVGRVLEPHGRFFASYFEAPASAQVEPIHHKSGVITYFDADPYHYAWEEIGAMARLAGMRVDRIGEWEHPRGQLMLAFRRDGA